MDTSLETTSLTEECTLNVFVFQHWWSVDFVGHHHTRSVPIVVAQWPALGRDNNGSCLGYSLKKRKMGGKIHKILKEGDIL